MERGAVLVHVGGGVEAPGGESAVPGPGRPDATGLTGAHPESQAQSRCHVRFILGLIVDVGEQLHLPPTPPVLFSFGVRL